MSNTIQITLTSTQYKALEFAAVDVSDFIENAATVRAAAATKAIISLLVAHCNENNIAIATGEDAQVAQAFSLGVVDTAANVAALGGSGA